MSKPLEVGEERCGLELGVHKPERFDLAAGAEECKNGGVADVSVRAEDDFFDQRYGRNDGVEIVVGDAAPEESDVLELGGCEVAEDRVDGEVPPVDVEDAEVLQAVEELRTKQDNGL